MQEVGEAKTIVRPWLEEDDEGALRVLNSLEPSIPPRTVLELRARRAAMEGVVAREAWVAELGGQVHGALTGSELGTRKRWEVQLGVAAPTRKRGIGRSLYAQLVERMAARGATHVYTWISEMEREGTPFAQRRGFRKTGRGERLSRLEVRQAKLEGFRDLPERLAEQGIEVRTLAEIGLDDESFLLRLCDLDVATHQEIPSSEPYQGFPFQKWLQVVVQGPGRSAEACWVALKGDRPIGLARLQREGKIAWNAYTGVDREYRGRGIARALKLRTIEWSLDNGVEFHYTGNEIGNESMLAINRKLGYQALPNQLEWVKVLA